MGSRSCLKNINCPCALRRLVEVHRGSRTSKIRFSDKFGGPKKGRKRNRDPLRLQFICSSFPEAPSVAGEAASSSSSNAADATSPIVAGGQARARMTTRRRCHRRQSARGGRGVVVHVPSTSEFDCDVDLLSSVEASHISHNFSSSSSFLLILNPPVGSIDLRTC
jgi:hypothetical protein